MGSVASKSSTSAVRTIINDRHYIELFPLYTLGVTTRIGEPDRLATVTLPAGFARNYVNPNVLRNFSRSRTPKPVFDIEYEPNLSSYYEIYDVDTRRTIVIMGETHTTLKIPKGEFRPLRDASMKLVNKVVVNGMMRDRRRRELKKAYIETPVPTECKFLEGGGPFDIDEETGEVKFNPDFKPEASIGTGDTFEVFHQYLIRYLEDALARQHIRSVPVDVRNGLLSAEKLSALYYPEDLIRTFPFIRHVDGHFHAFSQEERQALFLRFLYSLCVEVLGKITPSFKATLVGISLYSPRLTIWLNKILYLIREKSNMYGRLIQTYKFGRRRLREDDSPATEIEVFTLTEIMQVQGLLNHLLDIYTVRRILEDTETDQLILVYTGANHADNIAQWFLTRDCPENYVIRHVGFTKSTGPNNYGLTTRYDSEESRTKLTLLYLYAKSLEFDGRDNNPQFFQFEPFSRLFNEERFTDKVKASIRARELQLAAEASAASTSTSKSSSTSSTSSASSETEPSPWVEKRSRTSGELYWFNERTGESQWENPFGSSSSSSLRDH